ncbi:MAG: GHMP kinase [Cenarchaeum sp. SB0661_bin_35]|nr:GHMP kinase [Cenarchaeum sp. SB0667_bin_13]MXY37826.1 GHMP kinase [Cenarchaeum sp. SB0664_bin_35]MYC78954.1 GHMP kinase [Cenarchaeum sp. SB0661_bin_35]MYI51814.1 GHMP kinase [Cenarchaeum sp. SB0673_bin_9]
MEGKAFCPAHITGFFRADKAGTPEETGSVGAGFSIKMGVETTIRYTGGSTISVTGDMWNGMTEYAANLFYDMMGERHGVEINHKTGVPIGYGLGSSGAVALSTLYALNGTFDAGIDSQRLGQMAHRTELHFNSGLGDVLAAYHGGFEVRVKGGAPGYGRIKNLDVGDPSILIVCLAPSSTNTFLQKYIQSDDSMIDVMLDCGNLRLFQEMSMNFAKKNNVITAEMNNVIRRITDAGAPCGVAMVGETVFCMVPPEEAHVIVDALHPYDLYHTSIDTEGARIIQ